MQAPKHDKGTFRTFRAQVVGQGDWFVSSSSSSKESQLNCSNKYHRLSGWRRRKRRNHQFPSTARRCAEPPPPPETLTHSREGERSSLPSTVPSTQPRRHIAGDQQAHTTRPIHRSRPVLHRGARSPCDTVETGLFPHTSTRLRGAAGVPSHRPRSRRTQDIVSPQRVRIPPFPPVPNQAIHSAWNPLTSLPARSVFVLCCAVVCCVWRTASTA